MIRATVYAAIPVFNRLVLTRNCIRQLLGQTYQPIRIVVADGGSTDGTPEAIRDEFPSVTVLTPTRELWWAGAMSMAIEHVLASSLAPDDFLLMMNNDTEFPPDYVEILVRVAREQNAAVGALTVDSRDPTTILDAGEFIDWENYAFPVKTHVAPGEQFFDGVDVLPGRGSLVPLYMIRRAGNVDARRFPHYIADYEFFARLKRAGFKLGVTYETTLKSDASATGLAARVGQRTTFREALRLKFSRRSMDNLVDHYRFIDAAAPPWLRKHVKQRFVARLAHQALTRLHLMPFCAFAVGAVRLGTWLLVPPYVISSEQLAAAGVPCAALIDKGVIGSFGTHGALRHYFRRKPDVAFCGAMARDLYEMAARSGRRVPRTVLIKIGLYRMYCAMFHLYRVSAAQCKEFGLDPERLVADGIVHPDDRPGLYVFTIHKSKVRKHGVATVALYDHVKTHHAAAVDTRRGEKTQCAE